MLGFSARRRLAQKVGWRDTSKIDRLQEFMSTPMVTRTASAASRLALSDISADILQSEIRAMSVECDRIQGINLAQGVCDIDPPPTRSSGRHRRNPRWAQYLHALRWHFSASRRDFTKIIRLQRNPQRS